MLSCNFLYGILCFVKFQYTILNYTTKSRYLIVLPFCKLYCIIVLMEVNDFKSFSEQHQNFGISFVYNIIFLSWYRDTLMYCVDHTVTRLFFFWSLWRLETDPFYVSALTNDKKKKYVFSDYSRLLILVRRYMYMYAHSFAYAVPQSLFLFLLLIVVYNIHVDTRIAVVISKVSCVRFVLLFLGKFVHLVLLLLCNVII